jgi:hypothetical protein
MPLTVLMGMAALMNVLFRHLGRARAAGHGPVGLWRASAKTTNASRPGPPKPIRASGAAVRRRGLAPCAGPQAVARWSTS